MKKLLLETSFSKIYVIVMILITLLILGGYFSYAMFTVSKEKSNAISIVTGNLTYKLTVDGSNSSQLVIPAKSSKTFTVILSNPNNRIARFNFYYIGTLEEGVDTGYIEETDYNTPPSEAGINLEASGTSGSSNNYLIRVSNITDSEITINLGVSVGLDYNDLTLPSNGHLFRKITTTGTVADVIEDDIMNRLNYEDSEQTFITGEEPYNYIWYSGKLWRAVSIDPSDNSVKLVTEWCISAIPYNVANNSSFAGSYIEDWLNDTSVDGFLYNLRDYSNFIKTNSTWNATMTTSTSKPTKTTMVTDAVGLLNLYEYTMSYNNSANGYLNNGLNWTTLTPYNTSDRYNVNYEGDTNNNNSGYAPGIRPVVNLKGELEIVEGRGTETDPYRLEGDNNKDLNGTLLNTRYSGEYINFGTSINNLYRIVSHETNGLTKITSAEPLKNSSGFTSRSFGNTANFSVNNAIGQFLNTTYLNPSNDYLTSEQVNMITDSSTWYLGYVGYGSSYRLSKYTTATGTTLTTSRTTAKVGLLRLGEIMSGQFARSNLTTYYWTLTPMNNPTFGGATVRVINYTGAYYFSPTSVYGIRPVMNLKEEIVITGGEGTKENPFTIELA